MKKCYMLILLLSLFLFPTRIWAASNDYVVTNQEGKVVGSYSKEETGKMISFLKELKSGEYVLTLNADVVLDETLELKTNFIVEGNGHTIRKNPEVSLQYFLSATGETEESFHYRKIRNVNFLGDSKEDSGIGLIFEGKNIEIIGCNFDNLSTGVLIYSVQNASIVNSNFINNRGLGAGGAMVTAGKCEIRNCKFHNNYAVSGGALVLSVGNEVENRNRIENCEFKNNLAEEYGGAIFITSSGRGILDIVDSQFLSNSTESLGGAVYAGSEEAIVNVDNCQFIGNRTTEQGGAINSYSQLNLSGNTKFFNNRSEVEGGAIYSYEMDQLSIEPKVLFQCNYADTGFILHGEYIGKTNSTLSKTDYFLEKDNIINNYDIFVQEEFLKDLTREEKRDYSRNGYPTKPEEKVHIFNYWPNSGKGEFHDDVNEASEKYTILGPEDPKINMKRDGYTFLGWNTEADGTGKSVAIGSEYVVAEIDGACVHLYGQWEKIPEPWIPVKPVVKLEKHSAYIEGYPDGSIRPMDFITRGEAAAMVARLEGLSLQNSSVPNFSDTLGDWYDVYVNAVVDKGIMKGYPDGSFQPNRPITRGELAKMLDAMDPENDGLAPFADIVGHWAESSIHKAYGNARILGYPEDGTFRPDQSITRGETVAMLNRKYNRVVDEKSLETLKEGKIKSFTDLSLEEWYFWDMVEASNTHEYMLRGEKDELNRSLENWHFILN
ncbi:S-layer homology domain-containing protein [Peptoniphilus sp. KCTC 25270]|uniref:S-layer homology domain-containing protein n=1 Tax=Peptoniphilus sp. KCTC 25270 TaxID=2897414 RepID=UPI001E5F4704|nr:S-layer homology domain-containing protein [Peptoniphilus sp. KCTC 25270]MCD1147755.1 S-layer homology domain-containing protein [Peptoniphilus sp. KCTC 25270]